MITKDAVIKDVEEFYGEWLEMSHNPHALLAEILAQKVVSLTSQIVYLERRLQHVAT